MYRTSIRRHRGLLQRVCVVGLVAVLSCGKDTPTGANPGAPAKLTIVSGDAQSTVVGEELPDALVVEVLDAQGHPVAGQAVNFRVTAGGGSVFAGASITNQDGIAKERWTLGTVAGVEQTVEARAVDNNTGNAIVFATFHATAVPGPAAALAITTQPPTVARIGLVLNPAPAARLVDRYGNAVKQGDVSVSVALVGAATQSLDGTIAVKTDAQGVSTFVNLAVRGRLGSTTLSFSSSNLTAATSTAVVVSAGAPASLVALSATSVAGPPGGSVSTLPSVAVRDVSGNGVPNVSVQFSLSTNGGSASPTSAVTDTSGSASLARWTLPTAVGSYALVATTSELPNASITFTASVQAGAAAILTVVAGNNSSATVGTAAPPLVVKVTDTNGNPVIGASVAWSIVSGSGALNASSTLSGNDGLASDTVVMGTSTAAPTVIAAGINNTSVRFSVTPLAAAPAAIAKQGNNQTAQAGRPVLVSPAVIVTDNFGNPVPNGEVTYVLSGRRLAVRQGAAPVDVGASFNAPFASSGARSFYMNGQFYVTIGGVLFRLSF